MVDDIVKANYEREKKRKLAKYLNKTNFSLIELINFIFVRNIHQ